ncbi:glutamyl-tRNA reductase [Clostridium tarantellae]|nr:glutamyl-tRNA reductase [Clostridium tarantellae]
MWIITYLNKLIDKLKNLSINFKYLNECIEDFNINETFIDDNNLDGTLLDYVYNDFIDNDHLYLKDNNKNLILDEYNNICLNKLNIKKLDNKNLKPKEIELGLSNIEINDLFNDTKYIMFKNFCDEENINYIEEITENILIKFCNKSGVGIKKINDLKEILNKIFSVFGWNIEFEKYVFLSMNRDAIRHLMEVVCGFHSRILGEDQILGQIKNSYFISLERKAVSKELQRLFQDAIACGKKFRTESKMFEIPVSSASIAVNKGLQNGAKNFMVLGYGEIGKLVVKHVLSHKIDNLYIVVRKKSSVDDLEDSRVKILDYNGKNEFINNVQCIISCTAAPHEVIKFNDLSNFGEDISIFDLAVPRDVEKKVEELERIKLYDIDLISAIDDENKLIREMRMNNYKYIVNETIEEYNNWCNLRSLSPHIIKIKEYGDNVVQDRINTFVKKNKNNNEKLVKTLIKSASDAYINRAIEVLKEEKLRGCETECVRILNKVFNVR